jgi:hypothetical protein
MKKTIMILLSLISMLLLTGCVSPGVAVVSTDNSNVTINRDQVLITEDFLLQVARGNIEGAYLVHKFGANDNVATSLSPIASSGNYQTPTTAQSLEILSSNANDNNAGTGARKVKIIGLNSSGNEVSVSVSLNGLTAVAVPQTFLRVYRMFVEESGTYATQTTPSQAGVITLRASGGGVTWADIENIRGFGASQTEIAAYSIPKGFSCYLLSKTFSVNSIKKASVFFFQRQNITNTVAPYSAMRLVQKHIGVTGVQQILSRGTINKFPELTDIGLMASTDLGTAEVSAEFELLCLDNVLFP